ncbi:uncharacterized protein LOC143146617 isoform X1 [Ptiloglossa arizonensis]|uniref:uncharacterized protein LOC143146617 isoform X1 n=1 Tax=Ptiloglossa arizonensis TaxID=3350558 RepID=UPI003FA0FF51
MHLYVFKEWTYFIVSWNRHYRYALPTRLPLACRQQRADGKGDHIIVLKCAQCRKLAVLFEAHYARYKSTVPKNIAQRSCAICYRLRNLYYVNESLATAMKISRSSSATA